MIVIQDPVITVSCKAEGEEVPFLTIGDTGGRAPIHFDGRELSIIEGRYTGYSRVISLREVAMALNEYFDQHEKESK